MSHPQLRRQDVIIIGAGLSGICALHHILKAFPDWRVQAFEEGSDVGGVWYWNKYPGARFDSESVSYGYSFDQEILDEWHWKEAYSPQPETFKYIKFVVDRWGLRKYIKLNTRITAASWDGAQRLWLVTDEAGTQMYTRFLVNCLGFLSAPTLPAIPGLDSFQGKAFHTSRWPADLNIEQDFKGKRIGIIGNGASGIQTITVLSKYPEIASLHVFQRTASWSAPLRNHEIGDEEMAEIRAQYPAIFEYVNRTPGGFLHEFGPRKSLGVSEEERLEHWNTIYERSGMSKWLGVFKDTYTNREANALYSAFIAQKIRERVHDPVTAEALVPKTHGYGTRRVPLESGYFEAYNQPNVHLVDLRQSPLKSGLAKGLLLENGKEYELDILIYATGFDAVTGAFSGIRWSGRDGKPLVGLSDDEETRHAVWVDHEPSTYLGISVPYMPNMFNVLGPHQPFGNATPNLEHAVDVVVSMLQFCRDGDYTYMEAKEDAAKEWTKHVFEVGEGVLSNEVDSWMTGVNANVKGKTKRTQARYAGESPEYRKICAERRAEGWKDYLFD